MRTDKVHLLGGDSAPPQRALDQVGLPVRGRLRKVAAI